MNQFSHWLPMYAPDGLNERPWWHFDGDWMRMDGLILTPSQIRAGEDDYGAMARIDAENPMSAPPVLAGQVWVTPNGEQIQITHAMPGWTADTTRIGNYFAIECVLVDGAWAPWAPPGWTP